MSVVTNPLYSDSFGQRWYIEIDNKKYKVPYRYKRIMCKIPRGLKTLFELKLGDPVSNIEFNTVIWEGDVHYVLKSIDTCKEDESSSHCEGK
jgi:hypothetical protein